MVPPEYSYKIDLHKSFIFLYILHNLLMHQYKCKLGFADFTIQFTRLRRKDRTDIEFFRDDVFSPFKRPNRICTHVRTFQDIFWNFLIPN